MEAEREKAADGLVFEPVRTMEQIKEMTDLANEIWHEYFISILPAGQIDYMVEKFQSAGAVEEQLANQNYQYFMLWLSDRLIGYTGIVEQPKEKKLFLSKLYIEKSFRGRAMRAGPLNSSNSSAGGRGFR